MMPSKTDKSQPILIIGAGAFGLATALTLATSGYTDVLVLEKDDYVPSRFSAGFDLNKVVRAEYVDNFYTDLSLEAIRQWQTNPLYKDHFRQTGFLNVISAAAHPAARRTVENYFASVNNHPAFKGLVTRVSGHHAIRKLVPAFYGPVADWAGYYNALAGYSHSGNALKAVYEACVAAGIKFRIGKDGDIQRLLYTTTSSGRTCTGARSRSGIEYHAEKTILALGANVASLIPQIGKQVEGRCWGVAHIQLTPEEASVLRGIPVTNVRDLAFFFEPDLETNKLKFCHMGGGFTNSSASPDGLSLPYSELADSQYIPLDDELYIRRLLREVLPHLADRPLIDTHLCWFADSRDSDFIVDFVPGVGKSLVVLSGDSGHGFKMLPIFGKFTLDLLDSGEQKLSKWRWKDAVTSSDAGSAWRSSGTQELYRLERARL